MTEPRQPLLIGVTGRKGVGKTYRTFHFIWDYMQYNATTGKIGRKVLVFDPNQEYNRAEIQKAGLNYEIQRIALKDIAKFSGSSVVEARRVFPVNDDGTQMTLRQIDVALNIILEDFRTGLVVIDDINKFMMDFRYSQQLVGQIVTNRHRGQDIMLQYQSLAKMDTTIWQNIALLRFHQQTDDVDRYSNRIPTFDLVKIGQIITNDKYRNGTTYFYCYIDMHNYKISGDFTLEDFKYAVSKYLNSNRTQLMAYMRQENLNVKNSQEGIEHMFAKIYKAYYGNRK